jgi:hypothetical protein
MFRSDIVTRRTVRDGFSQLALGLKNEAKQKEQKLYFAFQN